jgi:hypothetical protein
MRKTLLFSVGLILFSCSTDGDKTASEKTTQDPDTCSCSLLKLDETYNHFFYSERTQPFTGVCIDNYPNNNPKMERSYVKGKVHGVLKEWHLNGSIKDEKRFDMNLQHGESMSWDESGNLIYHANYIRGGVDTVYVYIMDAFRE